MKMLRSLRKFWTVAVIGVVIGGGLAVAQAPHPLIPSLAGTEFVEIDNGVSASKVFATLNQLAALPVAAYSRQVPLTGFSLTIGPGVGYLVLDPAGTLATGTVTMPAAPADGQTAGVASSQTITALTVSANAGQTISNAVTTLAPGGVAAYVFVKSNTKWYRIQ